MKNKTLLEELQRMRVLMETSLINENWTRAIKQVTDLLQQIPALSKTYAKELSALAAATDDRTAIKILADLAGKERAFADKIIPIVYKSLPDSIFKEVSAIVDDVKLQIDGGVPKNSDMLKKNIDNRVDAINLPFDEIKPILKSDIYKVLDEYKAPPKPKPDDPTINPNNSLTKNLTALIEDLEKVSPGTISVKDRLLLLKEFPFRQFRAEANYLINKRLGTSNSNDKIVALMKKVADDLGKEIDGIPHPEVNTLFYATIQAELEALRKNQSYVMDELYRKLQIALQKGLGSYDKASKIIENIKLQDRRSDATQTYWDHLIDDTYIGKLRATPGKDVSWTTYLKNVFVRSWMFVLTGQIRKFGEIYSEFLKNKSVVGGMGYAWFYFTMITKVWIPLLYSFLDALFYGFIRETPAENVNGEYWRQWVSAFFGNLQDAFVEFEEVVDEETGKYIETDDINAGQTIIRTLVPFNYFIDDIEGFFDYVTAGRPREMYEDRMNRFRRRFENTGIPAILGTTTGGTTTGGTTPGVINTGEL